MNNAMVIYLPSVGLGASLFFFVRGLGKLARQRWRSALADLGIFVGVALVSLVLIGVIGTVIVKGESPDPAKRARVLAEFISVVMNCGGIAGMFALGTGLIDTVWLEPRRADPSSGSKNGAVP